MKRERRDNVVVLNKEDRPDKKKRVEDEEEIAAPVRNELLEELGVHSFEKEYKRLLKIVGAEKDFSSRQAAQALVRAQLAAAINAMPTVEKSVAKYGGRAVYAMVALGDHVRALTHDIQGFGDQSALVEKVRRDVMQAAMSALATDVVSQLTGMRHRLSTKLSTKDASLVGKELRSMQEDLTRSFTKAESRMHELLERALQQ
jgi:hypothetical protein